VAVWLDRESTCPTWLRISTRAPHARSAVAELQDNATAAGEALRGVRPTRLPSAAETAMAANDSPATASTVAAPEPPVPFGEHAHVPVSYFHALALTRVARRGRPGRGHRRPHAEGRTAAAGSLPSSVASRSPRSKFHPSRRPNPAHHMRSATGHDQDTHQRHRSAQRAKDGGPKTVTLPSYQQVGFAYRTPILLFCCRHGSNAACTGDAAMRFALRFEKARAAEFYRQFRAFEFTCRQVRWRDAGCFDPAAALLQYGNKDTRRSSLSGNRVSWS